MADGPEVVTVTCAMCGLVGRLERQEGQDVMSAFVEEDDFNRLCKAPAPEFLCDCRHWYEAEMAAIPDLKPQAKH